MYRHLSWKNTNMLGISNAHIYISERATSQILRRGTHRQRRPRMPARENNLGSKTRQSSHPCDGPEKKGGPIAVMTPTERGLARCQIPIRPSPRGREVLTIDSSRTTGARRPGGVRFAGCATLEMGRVWVWVCVMISSFPFRQAILW
jgi:hypothetical protein